MPDFNVIRKLPEMPVAAFGTDFDRAGDKDFYFAGQIKAEIYYCETDGLQVIKTLPTGFSRVLGGYAFSTQNNAIVPLAVFKPSGNGSVASVEGLALAADKMMVVVLGDK